eukprot:gene20233-25919_t
MNCRSAVALAVSVALLGACAQLPPTDVSTLLDRVMPTPVLMLGEQHDAPEHQALQRDVVLALAERGLVIANGRVTAGKASPVEATRAQVQLSEIRLERSRAEIGVSDAYRRLAAITGSANIGFERVESGALNTPALPSATQLL